jgi:hypothetical protein
MSNLILCRSRSHSLLHTPTSFPFTLSPVTPSQEQQRKEDGTFPSMSYDSPVTPSWDTTAQDQNHHHHNHQHQKQQPQQQRKVSEDDISQYHSHNDTTSSDGNSNHGATHNDTVSICMTRCVSLSSSSSSSSTSTSTLKRRKPSVCLTALIPQPHHETMASLSPTVITENITLIGTSRSDRRMIPIERQEQLQHSYWHGSTHGGWGHYTYDEESSFPSAEEEDEVVDHRYQHSHHDNHNDAWCCGDSYTSSQITTFVPIHYSSTPQHWNTKWMDTSTNEASNETTSWSAALAPSYCFTSSTTSTDNHIESNNTYHDGPKPFHNHRMKRRRIVSSQLSRDVDIHQHQQQQANQSSTSNSDDDALQRTASSLSGFILTCPGSSATTSRYQDTTEVDFLTTTTHRMSTMGL